MKIVGTFSSHYFDCIISQLYIVSATNFPLETHECYQDHCHIFNFCKYLENFPLATDATI